MQEGALLLAMMPWHCSFSAFPALWQQAGTCTVLLWPSPPNKNTAAPLWCSATHTLPSPCPCLQDVLRLCGITQLLDAALDGYNATVLAYGQTGSGKTFTMSGGQRGSMKLPGLSSSQSLIVVNLATPGVGDRSQGQGSLPLGGVQGCSRAGNETALGKEWGLEGPQRRGVRASIGPQPSSPYTPRASVNACSLLRWPPALLPG